MTSVEADDGRTEDTLALGSNLRSALHGLVEQEFDFSAGYLTAILNTCLFAPSLLTFWFVNGVLDFSTAVAIGAVATPAGLQVRLLAYLLLVPVFLLVRVVVHLVHPTHRRQVLAGSCPNTRLMSLDWFSMGILATGLPLAVQELGPWIAMNGIVVLGVFGLARFVPPALAGRVKIGAIVLGVAVFLFAKYGAVVPIAPTPPVILGPVATLTLDVGTVEWLFRLFNSVLFGPVVIGTFGVAMNHLLTRPELTDIPLVRHTLPRRDPDPVVSTNAATGTLFYLGVVFVATGHLVVFP